MLQWTWPALCFEGDPTVSLSCEANSHVWCKILGEADFQVLIVHLCLRTAYATPGLCSPVLWFMNTYQLICYKLCMQLNWVTFENLLAICMISDLTASGPAAQKEARKVMELMWLLATFPLEYGTIAKKKVFGAFCHILLIDGKQLLRSHTLLSNLISPSCNLTAQRAVLLLIIV